VNPDQPRWRIVPATAAEPVIRFLKPMDKLLSSNPSRNPPPAQRSTPPQIRDKITEQLGAGLSLVSDPRRRTAMLLAQKPTQHSRSPATTITSASLRTASQMIRIGFHTHAWRIQKGRLFFVTRLLAVGLVWGFVGVDAHWVGEELCLGLVVVGLPA